MTFYVLLNQVTSLFLSLNLLTTLSFDSEIDSYLYGGGSNEVFFQVTNNNRTLALKPKTDGKLSNLLVITKKRKYYFELSLSNKNPHQFIEVKHGVINHAMKIKTKNERYEVLEGKSSILFINKGAELTVNGVTVKSKEYFSKGVPIIVNGVRSLN